MPVLIGLRLTAGELDILDWLTVTRGYGSRSDTLRTLFLREAKNVGIQKHEIRNAAEERSKMRRRQSGVIVTLRRKAQQPQGGQDNDGRADQ